MYQYAFWPELSELKSRAERRPSREMPIGEAFVDDRRGSVRTSVRCVEEPAFAQTRADGGEVAARDDARERDLIASVGSGLISEAVERRLVVDGQRHAGNRASADDAGNRADLFQLRVDESDSSIEVGITEQWSDDGQARVRCGCPDRAAADVETSAAANRQSPAG